MAAVKQWIRERDAQVLIIWALATAVSFVILRLGAADMPETVWAPASPSWAEHLAYWDGGWYRRIADEGYPIELPVGGSGVVGQNAWAFMPVFPLLAKLFGLMGGFFPAAGMISLVSSAVLALISDRLMVPRVGGRASLWGIALFWCSPCAPVLQLAYAESLGLALLAAALLMVDRGRHWAALPFIVLASLTRPIGVPLGAALGLRWLVGVVSARRRNPGARRDALGFADLGVALVACASAFIWPVCAWAMTGRIDAYTATETAWRDGHLEPFAAWWERSQFWVNDHGGWLLLICVAVLAVAVLSAEPVRALGPSAWWCAAYAVYLAAFFDPSSSLLRLTLGFFPLAWALAVVLRRVGRRACFTGVVLGVIGQLFWVSWVWDVGTVSINWVP